MDRSDMDPEPEVLPMTHMAGEGGGLAGTDVSYEMVQQIMETERRRSRRALWAISFVFLLLMLLIVAILLVFGIFALNRNEEIANTVNDNSAQLKRDTAALKDDLKDMEKFGVGLQETLETVEKERTDGRQALQSDLESFSSYHESKSRRLMRSLERYDKRLLELEEAQLKKDQEIRMLRAVLEGDAARGVSVTSVTAADASVEQDGPPAELAGSKEPDAAVDGDTSTGITSTPAVVEADNEGDQNVSDGGVEPLAATVLPTTAVGGDRPLPFNPETGVKLDAGQYSGDQRDGKPHGHGAYLSENGDRYVGSYVEGVRHGKGILYFADGSIYEGTFADDRLTGSGVYSYPNGELYKGTLLNGLREGQGTYTYADGSVYSGRFQRDERQGKGVYTYPSGAVYEGYFKDGRMHGQGVYIFVDGTRIDGIWENGSIRE